MPSQLSGSTAVAIQVYQALYGRAPSNSLLASYTAQASANPQQTSAAAASAFANDLASGFQTTSSAVLAKQVLDNINITAATVTAPGSYTTLLSALEQAFTGFGPAARGQIILNVTNLIGKLEGDATYGVAATGFNNQAYSNFVYASNGNNVTPGIALPTPNQFELTGRAGESVVGTSGDDVFIARILSGFNTLESGDKISGGAGNDTLTADIRNPGFAITPETTSVESVQIRSQTVATDSSDNNILQQSGASQIDAQRMVGVNRWESTNSRADLIIEDVRILPNQITKDITIAFVESDPGHVDFGLYFDQLSLRSQSNTTSVLSIEILDTRSAALGTGPLKDNPYDSFAFLIGGVPIIVKSPAIDSALTYSELRAAVDAAITALKPTQPLLANFTVTLGAEFTRFDTQSGAAVKGTAIVLTDTGGGVLTVNPTAGFATPSGVVPPSSGLHTNISTVATSTTEKVTSKVILDDVGRGSTSGDLVIGGLSTGATSSSRGVERFEIRVDDNSKLESINSTNNTLQEVTIVNGLTTSQSFAYQTTVKDKGNLTVNGNSGLNGGNVTAGLVGPIQGNGNSGAGQQTGIDGQTGNNTPLPGSDAQTARNFGFSDVRLIDGSAFVGKLAFSAEITGASIPKYLNLRDIGALPSADNIAFSYSGGANDDALFVQIDGGAAGSRSTIVSGREDFTFTANGGAGNDAITVRVVDANGMQGGAQAWYTNQKQNANIFINGGDGNDTIRKPGAGDVIIDAGTGDDTVYADNTGNQGVTARSGSNGTTASIAYTNASAAELAAAQASFVASNTTGFLTIAATGTKVSSAAAEAALDALNLITPVTFSVAAPGPAPTYAQIQTGIDNAVAAGGLTFAQAIALDAAYQTQTTARVVTPQTTLAPQVLSGGVAHAVGQIIAADFAAGNSLLDTFISAAKAAAATATASDTNKATNFALLNVTQAAVANASDAINRVFDGFVTAGTQTTVTNLAALQAALVVGAGDAAIVTALQTAVDNGAITGGQATTLFTPFNGGGAVAIQAELDTANLTLATIVNAAANANAAATTALATATTTNNNAVNAAAAILATNPTDAGNNSAVANDAVGSPEAAAAAAAAATVLTAFNNGTLTPATTKAADLATLKAAIVGSATVAGATSELNVSILTANAVAKGTILAGDKTNIDTAANAGAPAVGGFVDLTEKFNVDLVITALQRTAAAVVADATITSANLATISAATATASTIAAAATASGGSNLGIGSPRGVFVYDTSNQLNDSTGTTGYNRTTMDDRNLADLKSDVNNTYNLYQSRLKVTFKGLDATVTVDSTNFRTSDLQINQAIKNAINSDPVLNKLLSANDGPSNTLVVSSLIDGVLVTSDLTLSLSVPATGTLNSADIVAAAAAYGFVGSATEGDLIGAAGFMTLAKIAFDTKGDYITQFAETGAAGGNTAIVGANSVTSSDNYILPGLGNDVIVLGTTVQTDLLTSSNDRVAYTVAGFGNDVIVNFAVAGVGIDTLDFSVLNGRGNVTFGSLSLDKSIVVAVETLSNDTAAEIAALFTDSVTAINHVYIAYDANNVGKVYTVADAAGTATGNVVATLVGTIDLASTGWGTVTAANFV